MAPTINTLLITSPINNSNVYKGDNIMITWDFGENIENGNYNELEGFSLPIKIIEIKILPQPNKYNPIGIIFSRKNLVNF